MMGHNSPAYEAWVEAAGYRGVKDLYTYDLDVSQGLPPIVQRIVASGERNDKIRIRTVDKTTLRRGGRDDPRHPQRCVVATIGGSCR